MNALARILLLASILVMLGSESAVAQLSAGMANQRVEASSAPKGLLSPSAATRSHSSVVSGIWGRDVRVRASMHSHLRPLLHRVAIRQDDGGPWEQRLAIAQGSYYLATGLWPILHMPSFEMVTGPKTDDWLVKTVGAMIAVVGGVLLVSGLDDGPSDDLKMVAIGSTAALTIVDVTYVARGRISSIYLLDAAAEIALMVGWGLAWGR